LSESEGEQSTMSRNKLMGWNAAWTVVCFCAITAIASPAQVFTTLVEFNGTNGASPQGSLVQGVNGNIYGTLGGGSGTSGMVFEMTPAGTLTTLYSFTGGSDGAGPAGLTQSSNGNLYGATYGGGNNTNRCQVFGCGTVFGITRTGKLTTLHRFVGTDGYGPTFAPTMGIDGNLYGITAYGGSMTGICKGTAPYGCGTVYKVTPTGQFTILHAFCQQAGCPDGSYPKGPLVQSSNGSFYGTTVTGPGGCCGTVFQITSTGNYKIVHLFGQNEVDGAYPTVLSQGSDGQLYGASYFGGATGAGVIFKLSLSGRFTKLHDLSRSEGGYITALTQAIDGNLYGPAQIGGANGDGIIFEITPAGIFTVLYDLSSTLGTIPLSPLLQSTSGEFYGTTNSGGTGGGCPDVGCGTIFTFNTGLGPSVAFVMQAGKAGQTTEILGQGFTGATNVSFNGVVANFKVRSDTFLTATVPTGATTGYVTVKTPGGTLSSNVVFQVIP
jgi:uncharacterized repeat protein (TIGR03803 family)